MEIPTSVTAYGRAMIFQTQQIVEANFDATVIYGDTDSVMVMLNGIGDIGEALRIGQEMEVCS